jgi:REP element-mobilizing transposase RayT
MSRLRRPFLYGRHFFVSVNLLRRRRKLEERDLARLDMALARMRERQRFPMRAWVSTPDPAAARHAMIYPPPPLSIAPAMSAIRDNSNAFQQDQ